MCQFFSFRNHRAWFLTYCQAATVEVLNLRFECRWAASRSLPDSLSNNSPINGDLYISSSPHHIFSSWLIWRWSEHLPHVFKSPKHLRDVCQRASSCLPSWPLVSKCPWLEERIRAFPILSLTALPVLIGSYDISSAKQISIKGFFASPLPTSSEIQECLNEVDSLMYI